MALNVAPLIAMQRCYAGDGGGHKYLQRAQAEAVNSMIKLNLGS